MAKNRGSSDKKLGDDLRKLRRQAALVLKDEELLDELLRGIRPKIEGFARTYANAHADRDQGAAQEAADGAIEKVAEFVAQLDNERAQRILDPDDYLLKVAHNSVREHFRGRREITFGHQDADYDEVPGGEDEKGGRGYIVLALPHEESGRRQRKRLPFVDWLLQYFCTPVGVDEDRADRRNLSEPAREAKLLVDTMPDDGTAKLILSEYSLGYRPSKIAEAWGLQKSNVSRTLKTWLNNWGWDEDKVKEVRLGFLLHNLADIADESERETNKIYRKHLVEKGWMKQASWPKIYSEQLYLKATTDHRTAAYLRTLQRDDFSEPGSYIGSFEYFVGSLGSGSGWGWNRKATRRRRGKKKYDWFDETVEDEREPFDSIHELW